MLPSFVSINGSGMSGSGAIYEFLSCSNIFFDPFPQKEFSLSYDPGGLIDIENRISNFSINNSTEIYHKTKRLLSYYTSRETGISYGKNFDDETKYFETAFSEFIDEVYNLNYLGFNQYFRFNTTILNKLRINLLYKIDKILKKKSYFGKLYMLNNIDDFNFAVQKLMKKIFYEKNIENKNILLNQGGTLFNPVKTTKFYNNCKNICVLRDPRDIYTEVKRKGYQFPGYSLQIFSSWYENLMQQINIEDKKNESILFINFEDFVLNREDSINKILNHLNIKNYDYKKSNFDFKRCENNCSIFKKELLDDEIQYLEKKLNRYIYQF